MSMAVGIAEERLRSAKRLAEDDLLFAVRAQAELADSGSRGYGFENIVGVGVGERHVSGRPTGDPVVTVYVVVKAPPRAVERPALVPSDYEGVSTDVVESGEFVAASQRGRFRPSPGGVSVSHFEGGAGTLGFVGLRQGALCIVGNNHVFARENEAVRGASIIQPAVLDGGDKAKDTIAQLADWTPLSFDGEPTHVDAAVAETEAGLVDARQISGLGAVVFRPLDVRRGHVVRKCGRTSGLTRGHVYDREATVKMRYRCGSVFLANQFLVKGLDGQPFSESGDSGSLVIEEQTQQPVGLLCGGSPRYTVATPIDRVLESLGLSFVA